MGILVEYAYSGRGTIIKSTTNPRDKQVIDEKAAIRERWFKTVVKIISWRDGAAAKKSSTVSKVTPQEWVRYCEETFKINASSSKSATQKKLADTEEKIKKNGGFAS